MDLKIKKAALLTVITVLVLTFLFVLGLSTKLFIIVGLITVIIHLILLMTIGMG